MAATGWSATVVATHVGSGHVATTGWPAAVATTGWPAAVTKEQLNALGIVETHIVIQFAVPMGGEPLGDAG